MDKPIAEAKGVGGQIAVYDAKVVISRRGVMGALTHGLKGDKEILIDQISSIQFKRAGALTNGFIQFAFVGGREAKGGLLEATHDENAVMFNSRQQGSFQEVKEAIDRKLTARSTSKGQAGGSFVDDLERLAVLKEKGIITEQEFAAKKKQVLGV